MQSPVISTSFSQPWFSVLPSTFPWQLFGLSLWQYTQFLKLEALPNITHIERKNVPNSLTKPQKQTKTRTGWRTMNEIVCNLKHFRLKKSKELKVVEVGESRTERNSLILKCLKNNSHLCSNSTQVFWQLHKWILRWIRRVTECVLFSRMKKFWAFLSNISVKFPRLSWNLATPFGFHIVF